MGIARRAALVVLIAPFVVALSSVVEARGSRRGGHSSGGGGKGGGSKGCGSRGGAGVRKSNGKCADKNGK